jgi:hypothetical protein
MVFWVMALRSSVEVYRRFGGMCHLHLQGWRLSQANNHKKQGVSKGLNLCSPYGLLFTGYLLGLLIHHEDGGDIFLHNVGEQSTIDH